MFITSEWYFLLAYYDYCLGIIKVVANRDLDVYMCLHQLRGKMGIINWVNLQMLG